MKFSSGLHPFLLVILVPYVARTLGLLYYYFGWAPGGRAMVAAPLGGIAWALPHHLCALSALFGLALLGWNLLPRMRRFVLLMTLVTVAAVIVIGQVDLSMRRYLGHGLTMSTVETYFDVSSVGDDAVMMSLKQDWIYVGTSLLGMALAVAFSAGAARGAVRCERSICWRWVAALGLAWAALACGGFYRSHGYPPEISLFRSLTGQDKTPPPRDEKVVMADLRAFVAPPPETRWLDERWPLLRQEPAPAVASSRPDIVFIVVESLRGQDVGFSSGRTPSITPNIDSLAASGVAFPHYIANGFASASSFITMQSSTWAHRIRLVSSQNLDLKLDGFPFRLGQIGYETVLINGCNPEFEKLLNWGLRWYGEVDYQHAQLDSNYLPRMSDMVLTDHAIERLARHDRENPDKPLMLSLFTTGMHQPYTVDEDGKPPSDDPQKRYDRALGHWDTQLGRLLTALRARPRWNNTVILLVGDHSHYTSESLPEEVRGMPVDPTVWTSGLVAGPTRLIGPSRRVEAVRSHVDVMPTILKLAGDRRPTSALGHDLLGDGEERTTIAVRGHGIRVDRGGMTVLFPHGKPDQVWVYKPFQAPAAFTHDPKDFPLPLDELKKIDTMVAYWSYLIEADRVSPGSPPP